MSLLNIIIRNNQYEKLEDLCKQVDPSFTLTKIKFQIQAGVLELAESATDPKALKGFLYLDSSINKFEKTEYGCKKEHRDIEKDRLRNICRFPEK